MSTRLNIRMAWSRIIQVNDEHNDALAKVYRQLAGKEENVIFGGRLAQYRYFDMAPVIEQVLNLKYI